MQYHNKYIFAVLLISTLYGCGQSGSNSPPSNSNENSNTDPNAPVLTTIGDKAVVSGSTLTFTVAATDPNNLPLTYSSDGTLGNGQDPYTDSANRANFDTNNGQFSWNTTGVALGDYYVEFSVMNSAALTDRETIKISVQTQLSQYQLGQTLYNNNCRGSGCHINEDTNQPEGAVFAVTCSSAAIIKAKTEEGPGSMPTFDFTDAEEAAISYYLNNVRPAECQ